MAKAIMNFGCGIFCPDGYLNVDGSLTVLLAHMPLPAVLYGPKRDYVDAIRAGRVRYGTARRLRVPNATLDGFYASHVLEHMPRDDCMNLLGRVRLWLKPTGLVRIVLPDLRMLADQYTDGRIGADRFVDKMHMAIDGMSAWKIASSHAFHRWMYDVPSFTAALNSLGYTNIQVCQAAESALTEFAELDRKIGREDQSFYVEAAPGR
jgi:predicted SAM-dependent methyltransferase